MPKLTETVKSRKRSAPRTQTERPPTSTGAWGHDPIISKRLGEVTPTATVSSPKPQRTTQKPTAPAQSRPAARWSVMPYLGVGLAVVGAVAAFVMRGKIPTGAPVAQQPSGDWEALSGTELLRRYGRV